MKVPSPFENRPARFPILNPKGIAPDSVPWEFVEPHREQAYKNHHQTLEELARRGGLDPVEMLAVVTGQGWKDWTPPPYGEAVSKLLELLSPDRMTPDRWNARYPIGTKVRVTSIRGRDGRPEETFDSLTMSQCWALGNGCPVVLVAGKSGGYSVESGWMQVLDPEQAGGEQ